MSGSADAAAGAEAEAEAGEGAPPMDAFEAMVQRALAMQQGDGDMNAMLSSKVGRCKLEPTLKATWFQPLNLRVLST